MRTPGPASWPCLTEYCILNFEFPPSYSRVLAESRKMASSQARRGSIEVDLGHATTTVEYRSCDNDVLIAGRYVRHRYTQSTTRNSTSPRSIGL